jgi:hypothetical protein
MAKGLAPRFNPPDGLYIKLDMQATDRDMIVTQRDHSFDNGVLRIVVPAQFRCDLGSLPWFCYLIISPYGRAQRGFLFHDVLYRSQVCSRYLADVCLRVIHRSDGVWWWQRILVYWALRMWAWWSWWKAKKNKDIFLRSLEEAGGGVA